MGDYSPQLDGAALDRYITGNYGEDQFRDLEPEPLSSCCSAPRLEGVESDICADCGEHASFDEGEW